SWWCYRMQPILASGPTRYTATQRATGRSVEPAIQGGHRPARDCLAFDSLRSPSGPAYGCYFATLRFACFCLALAASPTFFNGLLDAVPIRNQATEQRVDQRWTAGGRIEQLGIASPVAEQPDQQR